jgi:hypothetical protein
VVDSDRRLYFDRKLCVFNHQNQDGHPPGTEDWSGGHPTVMNTPHVKIPHEVMPGIVVFFGFTFFNAAFVPATAAYYAAVFLFLYYACVGASKALLRL